MKHRDLVDQLTEAIKIDVEVGDTILAGRFKNKKVKVKSIGCLLYTSDAADE